MRTKKMRLLSFVLALAMMLAIAPVGAFAEGESSEEDPMGKLIEKQEGEDFIFIDHPGTYQMRGKYDVPVLVTAAGEVIINITDEVDYTGELKKYTGTLNQVSLNNYPINYAINAINPDGNLTINNEGNYKFSAIGENNARGVLRVFAPLEGGAGHAVVNYGYYTSGNVEKSKETFFNHYGTLTLNHVNAYGTILLKNYGGTTEINGGSYKRNAQGDAKMPGALVNRSNGTLKLTDATVEAENNSALYSTGGTMTVIGGNISTADKEVSAVLVNEGYNDSLNTNGIAVIEIRGATIKNSARGLEVKSGNIVLKDVAFENNESDIYLNDGQKLEEVVDTTGYTGKPLTAKVTDANGTTLEAVKDATLTVEGGTVKVDASAIENANVTANKDDDTTTASVPAKALVTVTYDEAAYTDSNLKFNGWTITGLANAEDYKNQQSFTFEMPANNVTIKAGTATTDTDDGIDAATVITGVAIGAGAAVLTYHIGTELYAEQVLGKGVSVPKTREEVALKAWELAGKPAVELNGEPLSEAAQAEQWAVESGLMQNDAEGNFNGAKKMNKLKALRVLDSAKKMNAQ